MFDRISSFIDRNEKLTPFILFFLFLLVTVPGVNWGVPALWNPDELVWRVDKALIGELVFDETEPDFNYPSLPKYVMFGIGKIVYSLGYSRSEMIVSTRVFSALLGAIASVLIFYFARMAGARVSTSGLAGLFYIAGGVAAVNGRFAHNDLYLQLFSILCVFYAVKYELNKSRIWLYASFFSVGLAASSKFTGGSLLLVPLFVFVILNWANTKKDLFRSFEILLIGAVLSFGGYVVGTPKALLWLAFYFKRVIPALKNYPLYGQNSGSPIGLIGQWSTFHSAVGVFAYYLFILTLIWFIGKLILSQMGKAEFDGAYKQTIKILLVTLLIFDLPFLVSINYIERYFIPFVPFLSILGAFFIAEIFDWAGRKQWKYAPSGISFILAGGILYSLLRLTSIALLFMNDARMPAGEFIARLPGRGMTIEYTLYPPNVNKQQFDKARNYPIYFVKYPNDVVPTDKKFKYNQGEQGLLDREVNYLVIDTLTYSRFYKESVCETNPVECDFFRRLLAGEVRTFRLVSEFTYTLPPYLPNVTLTAVNPGIRIYERIK